MRGEIENAQRNVGLHDLKLLRILVQEIAVSQKQIHAFHPLTAGQRRKPRRIGVSTCFFQTLDLLPQFVQPGPARSAIHNRRFTQSESRRSTPTDRKSTRLNSSHRTISYAVFCLKKK